MRWLHGLQKMAARLVPFPHQGTAVLYESKFERRDWNNANFGPINEHRSIERTWKTKVGSLLCGVALGTCPVSLLKCPRDGTLQPQESDLVEQALVADLEPPCGGPTLPVSLLQTSAELTAWRQMSFSPGAARSAVSSLARAAHRAPTTGRFDKAAALVSCAPSCWHGRTIPRT
jgi:hypothetical protein